MTMRSFLEDRVERKLTKPLLHYEGEAVSYEEFDRRVNRAARGFWELGVRKGDKVSLMLPNVPEFLYAWFGLAKIGAVMVPVNTGFKPSEASYVVGHSAGATVKTCIEMGAAVDLDSSRFGAVPQAANRLRERIREIVDSFMMGCS